MLILAKVKTFSFNKSSEEESLFRNEEKELINKEFSKIK